MYHVLFMIGLFAFCNGDQWRFNKTCNFSKREYSCRMPSEISVQASSKSCKSRSILLVFTVLEDRGRPCLEFGVHHRSIAHANCYYDEVANFEFKSFDNGTYSFNVLYNENETRYFRISGENCEREGCAVEISSSIFDDCAQPDISTAVFSNNLTTAIAIATTKKVIMHIQLTSIIAVVILVLLLYVFYHEYRRYHKQKEMDSKFFEISIVPCISFLTIYLVFLDEHIDHHKSVVLRLAAYLKERFGVTILFELYNREKIYENPSSWLEKSLSNSDVVLVIWSPGAMERWHNPERYTDRLDLFTPVLKLVKTELGLQRNLSKFMFGYFEYCDCNDIPESIQNSSIPCLKLMTEFYSFCNKLSKVANKSQPQSDRFKVIIEKNCTESILAEATSLEASISKISSFLSSNKAFKTKVHCTTVFSNFAVSPP